MHLTLNQVTFFWTFKFNISAPFYSSVLCGAKKLIKLVTTEVLEITAIDLINVYLNFFVKIRPI